MTKLSVFVVLGISALASTAHAQDDFYQKFLQQPAVLEASKPGTVTGSLSKFDSSAESLSSGNFSYTLPLDFRTDRGPLLVSMSPSYNNANGLSEWGMGWNLSLSITRTRLVGHIKYDDRDIFSSPWGLLKKGHDGHWYPEGLSSLIRVEIGSESAKAFGPDGRVYSFDRIFQKSSGTYSYHLTQVTDLKGRVTTLTYQKVKSVIYLTTVAYGGKGTDLPYEISFEYETQPSSRHWMSFQSGSNQVLSKTLSKIRHNLTLDGETRELWSYELAHRFAEHGPVHFLTSVTKTFPSGEKEPAIRFSYDYFNLDSLSYETTSRLDRLADYAIRTDSLSFYDFNEDGLVDIEVAEDHSLYLQGQDGFRFQQKFEKSSQNDCLSADSPLNQPRKVARMRGRDTTPMVFHPGTDGRLTICDLDGTVQYNQKLPFTPSFGKRSLLVDLNGDSKPDIYHLSDDDRYEVYENTSTDDAIAFTLYKEAKQKKLQYLKSLHSGDLNGDGYLDIIAITGNSVKAFIGRGNFEFTSSYLSLSIEDTTSLDVSTYSSRFVDLNHDGMDDLILTKNKTLKVFMNNGRSFERASHEAFEGLALEGSVFIKNIIGTGEQILFRSTSEGIRFARLNTAKTNLLTSIDDGKGSMIAIDYRYYTGDDRAYHPSRVVKSIKTSRGLEGTRLAKIIYHKPYYRSETGQKKAFQALTLSTAEKTVTAEFVAKDHEVHLASRSTKSVHFPHISLDEGFEYENFTYFGVDGSRRSKSQRYYTDANTGSKTNPVVKTVEERTEKLCPKLETSTHGSKSLSTEYTYLAATDVNLHCQTLSAKMLDNLASEYLVKIDYNRNKLPTEVSLMAETEKLTLQRIEYDELNRVKLIEDGKGKWSRFSYLGDSDYLTGLENETGTAVANEGLTERDLFSKFISINGASKFTSHASFDGFDRLQKEWNSELGSALSPLKSYEYGWASLSKAGFIKTSTNNLSGGYFDTFELFSGGHRKVAVVTKNDDQAWVGTSLTSFDLETTAQKSYAARILSDDFIAEVGTIKTNSISDLQETSLSITKESTKLIVDGKSKRDNTTLSIENGSLLKTVTTNTDRSKITAYDSNLVKVYEIDEEGNTYSFNQDSFGRFRKLALPSGKTIEASFDKFGQPEISKASSIGSLKKTYTTSGLLETTSRLDRSGSEVQKWTYTYDSKGRVKTKTGTAGDQSITFTYGYDGLMANGTVSPNQLGHLSSIVGEHYSKDFIFDEKGRLSLQSIDVPAHRIQASKAITYDALDRVVAIRSEQSVSGKSSHYTMTLKYDALGRPYSTTVGAKSIVSIYDELGRLHKVTGLSDITYEVDALTGLQTGFESKARSLNYSQIYNSFGEIDSENYDIKGKKHHRPYDYDKRSFLTSSVADSFRDDFDYTEDGDLVYDISNTPSLGEKKFKYDEAGRLKSMAGKIFSYGPHGRVSSIANNAGSFALSYDENNLPLLMTRDGQVEWFTWQDLTLTGGTWSEPVKAGSHIVAWVYNGELQPKNYDFKGSMISESPSSPYGRYNLSESSVVDFAGHPYLVQLGLVSMKARFYSPELGRFISPDPLFLGRPELCVESPIECNLYSYAKNSPLKYVDPSGLMSAEAFDQFLKAEIGNMVHYVKHQAISAYYTMTGTTKYVEGSTIVGGGAVGQLSASNPGGSGKLSLSLRTGYTNGMDLALTGNYKVGGSGGELGAGLSGGNPYARTGSIMKTGLGTYTGYAGLSGASPGLLGKGTYEADLGLAGAKLDVFTNGKARVDGTVGFNFKDLGLGLKVGGYLSIQPDSPMSIQPALNDFQKAESHNQYSTHEYYDNGL